MCCIHCGLIWNFFQVFHGLKILSSCDAQFKGGTISTNEEMANYLQPRLLGVLAFFDSQLLQSSIPMEEKRPVSINASVHTLLIYVMKMYNFANFLLCFLHSSFVIISDVINLGFSILHIILKKVKNTYWWWWWL